jgi:TetR/AcrR family transcriptional regulator
MLLFGMINWTFTWLDAEGPVSHAELGEVVAALFFGGLGAVVRRSTPTPARRTRGNAAATA